MLSSSPPLSQLLHVISQLSASSSASFLVRRPLERNVSTYTLSNAPYRSYQHHSLWSRAQWYAEDARPIHGGLRSNLRVRSNANCGDCVLTGSASSCPSAPPSVPTVNVRSPKHSLALADSLSFFRATPGFNRKSSTSALEHLKCMASAHTCWAHIWGINCTILRVKASAVCTYIPPFFIPAPCGHGAFSRFANRQLLVAVDCGYQSAKSRTEKGQI